MNKWLENIENKIEKSPKVIFILFLIGFVAGVALVISVAIGFVVGILQSHRGYLTDMELVAIIFVASVVAVVTWRRYRNE